ncbi:L-proline dehydrogenase [Roseimicrobium gellanilyticum]|uniref:L-glutamate gamma-semialdehyde dehydrogenase n=1 Tax=Roseimicrobium gellanilyticum TaxID=748857 RepID=A0A366HBS4_9BACT|nr:bifunctional proline dehydrogenase/L-glutamate gamma-semialdehyde dehydrogenase [Roseimicrobium gellanilyticum]RBP39094.1 L-proline dehydrogenase [Roseimicrobium gellanilyticum]
MFDQASTIQRALDVARGLQQRATELQTAAERRQQAELDRMLQTSTDKATLVQLTDQAFRAKSSARVVDQFTHILDVQGIPRFFSPLDRAMLRGFQTFGGWLPGVSVPMVKGHMQQETANVILPAEPELLAEHLRQRREQGVRMNVNFLGEAILSEAEAGRRLEQCLEALQAPDTEVLSVKISTLYSQMSPIAREHTITTVCDRLERLYRSAARSTFTRTDGSRVPKFIYLDMEEYRDLSLTCEVFMRTLDRPGLEKVSAGIALQAYVPDSARWQRIINAWARKRTAAGGASVTIRLVKGANMEMERFEAALKDWPQAPFKTKLETDANYKRMLHEGLAPENLPAVRLGIASHNLFDVAYALTLVQESNAFDHVQFEMLEGMANHQRRALFERASNLLLYAPVCRKEHFLSAIGYLIRRLDENTGEENFLRHAFKLSPGSAEWRGLERGFRESFALLPDLNDAPRRTQDRRLPAEVPLVGAFRNEPDTDWSLPHHAEWAQSIVEKWKPLCDGHATEIPLVLDGKELLADRKVRDCVDPSRPGVIVGRYRQASAEDVARAVECAANDPDGWRDLDPTERQTILKRVAQELRQARADLMGAAMANGGKVLTESDPEVSEAVDFAEFYAATARMWMEGVSPHLIAKGKGVVVVVSPWNFPIAIPCGGVVAALAAGNTVILKPASDAVLVAWEFCKCFWRAGVSRQTLQFVPCSGGTEGRALVQHPKVNAVILTGGTETALHMLRENPALPLSAETGGKNVTTVTALSDRDLAIKNVLHSAFSHAGQKCSATSLLLLEAEVYDDPQFKRALVEAAESLTIGSAWDLTPKMGPLIRPPSGDLENALQTLEPGESWALMPQRLEGNPHLWSPGIKWGVQSGSYTHLTEFFGPVLGVMRYEKLHEAIALVNQTGFGLTSGLESLDDREQTEWRAGIRAGNLYINRTTVGAIVLRQPFGGMGKSAFGPGIKAGGPNYVAQFMEFSETLPATPSTPRPDGEMARLLAALQDWDTLNLTENSRLIAAFTSYERAWEMEFGVEHDDFRLPGQDNIRRYLPVRDLRIRLHPDDTSFDLFARVAAARVAGCRITVSSPPHLEWRALTRLQTATEGWAGAIEFVEESNAELARIISEGQTDRVRYASAARIPLEIRRASAEVNVFIADAPVLMEGRAELLWYVQEQSLSFDYHRYGNLGMRSGEARAEPK